MATTAAARIRYGSELPFVGRERESGAVATALAAGLNVVIEGRYGIGRSALLRETETRLGRGYRFAYASLELTPAAICHQLLDTLTGPAAAAKGARRAKQAEPAGRPRRLPPRPGRQRFAAVRAELLRLPLADSRVCVLVLDDLGRLSAPQLDLIRRLAAGGRFRLVTILEPFLPETARRRLASWIEPARHVTLGPLPLAAARLFFRLLAGRHGLPWSVATIDGLARASGGHPLQMVETAGRELTRTARLAAGARAPVT